MQTNEFMDQICREIMYEKYISVPMSLRPQPFEKNYMGYTLAQWFIVLKNTEPEKWMIHNPLITNNNGNTCMMLWIKFAKDELKAKIPKWMLHDPWIKNGYEKSSIVLWYYYTDQPLPLFLKKKPIDTEDPVEISNEELYHASVESYGKIAKSKPRIIKGLCLQVLRKRNYIYITPQSLYDRYNKNLKSVYGEIQEEEFHQLVSKKHTRKIINEVVYYDIRYE